MTRVGRDEDGRPSPAASPRLSEENLYPGRAEAEAVGRQQRRQALLPGNRAGKGQVKGPGRSLQTRQVLREEKYPPSLSPQGLEQPVPIEKTPVVHRHPGLGNRGQCIIKPDEFMVMFGGNHSFSFLPEMLPGTEPRST